MYEDIYVADKVGKAFAIAYNAHFHQTRKDRTPYITHPLAVASYVIQATGMAEPTLVSAALLHDVVEDTDITLEDLSKEFDDGVVKIVEKLTRFKDKESREDYMNKILKSNDYFVWIIKLADVTHNLETIDVLPEENRKRFIEEVMKFYLPLTKLTPNGEFFKRKMVETLKSHGIPITYHTVSLSNDEVIIDERLVANLAKRIYI
ncbi:MAG: bifunctional (p)ppGpp synthetase/guanosine-3',5'-bis(diphosphate) 3'-pyrophosphohydrolase [Nanoarchaeota archaeon]|nr:bifunctional (p)ppGpp synthetase/guanosine-3',5'-bis(diphosphate) 3'-pyrophosphohydrolase [Nanoarchaeota archaeon]